MSDLKGVAVGTLTGWGTLLTYISLAMTGVTMAGLSILTFGIGFFISIFVGIVFGYVYYKSTNIKSKSTRLQWLMSKLYGGMSNYIWKMNGWGTYNKDEKWCKTILKIDGIMTKPYEKIWILMLYTEKRILWENLTSPFFPPSMKLRHTFMDKKDENLKKINASLTKWSLSSVFSKVSNPMSVFRKRH